MERTPTRRRGQSPAPSATYQRVPSIGCLRRIRADSAQDRPDHRERAPLLSADLASAGNAFEVLIQGIAVFLRQQEALISKMELLAMTQQWGQWLIEYTN